MERRCAVSVIILTKNGERHLRSLLDALYAQDGIAEAEVIVIDSGSSDATLDIVAGYPVRLTRIPPEEFGHGRTRNLGARLAGGEFLVFLPQDATPVGTAWLKTLLQPFGDAAVAGAYGRQVARPDASAMETFFLARTYGERPAVRRLEGAGPTSLSRCFFSTVAGAVRASVWRTYPFREDVIMSEDQAWSDEVMRAGHAIAYEARAVVLHSHRYGVADVFRRNFDSGFSIRQIFGGRTGVPARAILAYLAAEASFVLRAGSAADVLRFPFYEAARHLGFWLGTHAKLLPVALRRACGNLGYFWNRN